MKNEEWMRMKNKQLLTFDREESLKGRLLIPLNLLFLLMFNDKSVLVKLKMSLRIYLELSWPNCLEFDYNELKTDFQLMLRDTSDKSQL